MAGPQVHGSRGTGYRLRARQWSRMAWVMALLLASLPIASRFFLGGWDFGAVGGMAILCAAAGTYLHIVSRRFPALPDPAAMLDRALQLAAAGHIEKATALLTKAIQFSPNLWQAFQYRGELFLSRGFLSSALQDFDDAIRLAPGEPQLYSLRGHVHGLAGDYVSAQRDSERALALAGKGSSAGGQDDCRRSEGS